MVLDRGEVVEFASPAVLQATEGSIYRSLLEETRNGA